MNSLRNIGVLRKPGLTLNLFSSEGAHASSGNGAPIPLLLQFANYEQ